MRIYFTIERPYHDKIKALAADDSRSTYEWLRVKIMNEVDKAFPELQARLESEAEAEPADVAT